tara:strand:- start:637 stop:831 length:195 start_codon:yes stop_codon:yes gene_type:complete
LVCKHRSDFGQLFALLIFVEWLVVTEVDFFQFVLTLAKAKISQGNVGVVEIIIHLESSHSFVPS